MNKFQLSSSSSSSTSKELNNKTLLTIKLFTAYKNNNIEEIKSLVANGADFNTKIKLLEGMTVLQKTIEDKKFNMFDAIWESAPGEAKQNALILPKGNEEEQEEPELLLNFVIVTLRDETQLPFLRKLVTIDGIRLHPAEHGNFSAIDCAVMSGNLIALKFFINHLKEINRLSIIAEISEKTKCGPLHYAVQVRDVEMVKVLLEAGADPSAKYANYSSAKDWLARSPNKNPAIEALFAAYRTSAPEPINISSSVASNETKENNSTSMEPIDSKKTKKDLASLIADSTTPESTFRELVEQEQLDPHPDESKQESPYTPLEMAIRYKNLTAVRIFIEHLQKNNRSESIQRKNCGETLLHLAAQFFNEEIIILLFDAKVDPKVQNQAGFSADEMLLGKPAYKKIRAKYIKQDDVIIPNTDGIKVLTSKEKLQQARREISQSIERLVEILKSIKVDIPLTSTNDLTEQKNVSVATPRKKKRHKPKISQPPQPVITTNHNEMKRSPVQVVLAPTIITPEIAEWNCNFHPDLQKKIKREFNNIILQGKMFFKKEVDSKSLVESGRYVREACLTLKNPNLRFERNEQETKKIIVCVRGLVSELFKGQAAAAFMLAKIEMSFANPNKQLICGFMRLFQQHGFNSPAIKAVIEQNIVYDVDENINKFFKAVTNVAKNYENRKAIELFQQENYLAASTLNYAPAQLKLAEQYKIVGDDEKLLAIYGKLQHCGFSYQSEIEQLREKKQKKLKDEENAIRTIARSVEASEEQVPTMDSKSPALQLNQEFVRATSRSKQQKKMKQHSTSSSSSSSSSVPFVPSKRTISRSAEASEEQVSTIDSKSKTPQLNQEFVRITSHPKQSNEMKQHAMSSSSSSSSVLFVPSKNSLKDIQCEFLQTKLREYINDDQITKAMRLNANRLTRKLELWSQYPNEFETTINVLQCYAHLCEALYECKRQDEINTDSQYESKIINLIKHTASGCTSATKSIYISQFFNALGIIIPTLKSLCELRPEYRITRMLYHTSKNLEHQKSVSELEKIHSTIRTLLQAVNFWLLLKQQQSYGGSDLQDNVVTFLAIIKLANWMPRQLKSIFWEYRSSNFDSIWELVRSMFTFPEIFPQNYTNMMIALNKITYSLSQEESQHFWSASGQAILWQLINSILTNDKKFALRHYESIVVDLVGIVNGLLMSKSYSICAEFLTAENMKIIQRLITRCYQINPKFQDLKLNSRLLRALGKISRVLSTVNKSSEQQCKLYADNIEPIWEMAAKCTTSKNALEIFRALDGLSLFVFYASKNIIFSADREAIIWKLVKHACENPDIEFTQFSLSLKAMMVFLKAFNIETQLNLSLFQRAIVWQMLGMIKPLSKQSLTLAFCKQFLMTMNEILAMFSSLTTQEMQDVELIVGILEKQGQRLEPFYRSTTRACMTSFMAVLENIKNLIKILPIDKEEVATDILSQQTSISSSPDDASESKCSPDFGEPAYDNNNKQTLPDRSIASLTHSANQRSVFASKFSSNREATKTVIPQYTILKRTQIISQTANESVNSNSTFHHNIQGENKSTAPDRSSYAVVLSHTTSTAANPAGNSNKTATTIPITLSTVSATNSLPNEIGSTSAVVGLTQNIIVEEQATLANAIDELAKSFQRESYNQFDTTMTANIYPQQEPSNPSMYSHHPYMPYYQEASSYMSSPMLNQANPEFKAAPLTQAQHYQNAQYFAALVQLYIDRIRLGQSLTIVNNMNLSLGLPLESPMPIPTTLPPVYYGATNASFYYSPQQHGSPTYQPQPQSDDFPSLGEMPSSSSTRYSAYG